MSILGQFSKSPPMRTRPPGRRRHAGHSGRPGEHGGHRDRTSAGACRERPSRLKPALNTATCRTCSPASLSARAASAVGLGPAARPGPCLLTRVRLAGSASARACHMSRRRRPHRLQDNRTLSERCQDFGACDTRSHRRGFPGTLLALLLALLPGSRSLPASYLLTDNASLPHAPSQSTTTAGSARAGSASPSGASSHECPPRRCAA
jgi:hypothetical protein